MWEKKIKRTLQVVSCKLQELAHTLPSCSRPSEHTELSPNIKITKSHHNLTMNSQ